jgi:hypothetical protein
VLKNLIHVGLEWILFGKILQHCFQRFNPIASQAAQGKEKNAAKQKM